jgi:hypothetical protein
MNILVRIMEYGMKIHLEGTYVFFMLEVTNMATERVFLLNSGNFYTWREVYTSRYCARK